VLERRPGIRVLVAPVGRHEPHGFRSKQNVVPVPDVRPTWLRSRHAGMCW
jgi:hypothetical protein